MNEYQDIIGAGLVLWRVEKDVWGTMLALSVDHGRLVMSYQPTRFRLPSEVGGRIGVFHVADGYRLWDKKASYASRPLINDTTIFAQGGGWDLDSGEDRPFGGLAPDTDPAPRRQGRRP